ncbi:hypothetical protein ACROYT_G004323 [Oculina patagonica]
MHNIGQTMPDDTFVNTDKEHQSEVAAEFIMKCHVVLAIFCVVVSLYVVFLCNLGPVSHLVQEKFFNRMEQHFIFHEKDRLQREETTNGGKRTKKSEIAQGIQSSYKLQETTSKMQISESSGTKHPQKSAPRTNLIILSPGRGGSSFLGELFDSNPQIMYWFEPLRVVKQKLFKVDLLQEGKEQIHYKNTCVNIIDSFFKCNFNNITNATLSKFSRDFSRRKSKALTNGYLCPNGRCLPFSNALLSKACNSYKHTVIKILHSRVPNKTIQSLQELFQQQDRYDVKLIHLVRDPRAVIYSRVYAVKWIKRSYLDQDFRFNVHQICDPIEQNIRMGLLYPPPWLRNRFKVIRYEDLAVNTANIAQELYGFAGFDWSASVDKWISAHNRPPNNPKERRAYSLYRNASHVIDKWKNAPKELIKVVEDICGDLMNMLGYEKWITKNSN